MSNELDKELATAIRDAADAMKSGAEWMQGELPAFIQELLMWEMVWSATVAMATAVILCALAYTGHRALIWAYRHDQEHPRDDAVFGVILAMVFAGAPASLIAMAFFAASVHDFVMVTIAPRVYLLEYARGLVG